MEENTLSHSRKYKARRPVQERGVITRKKILDAAMAEFSEKGYHSTNAMLIAKRAGLATGTFYSYFNDKKEVMIEIIRMFYDDLSKKALFDFSVTIPDTFEGRYKECRRIVRNMLDILYTSHVANPNLFEQIYAMVVLDPDIKKANRDERRKVFSHLMVNLITFKEFTKIKDLETAVRMLFVAGDEIIRSIRFLKKEEDRLKMLEELEVMISKYVMLPEP